jgi:sulfatase maturation enzyme AslB (radical SAM superfamily)
MTRLLNTGLFVRDDTNLGTIVYSPFTGLLFSCIETKEAKQYLLCWMNGSPKSPPNEQYLRSLGAGWALDKDIARYPRNHFLSSSGMLPHSYKPDSLLVINWLVTVKCSFACKYCYARDIMAIRKTTPEGPDMQSIAKQILSYHPLAVVLTGGDPLEKQGIEVVLDALHGRTGIIIDTNGVGITERNVELFKRYGVFVRVSLDSERPKVNNALRPSRAGQCSLDAAIRCINLCLSHGIGVGVQTVITKMNMSDIQPLGHKLYRLGITSWRLQILANHSCFDDYDTLKPNLARLENSILPALGQVNRTGWDEVMSIQVVANSVSNAVVLVSPDGRFLTELNGKVPLSKVNARSPTMKQIMQGPLNLDAHTDRYLNIGQCTGK